MCHHTILPRWKKAIIGYYFGSLHSNLTKWILGRMEWVEDYVVIFKHFPRKQCQSTPFYWPLNFIRPNLFSSKMWKVYFLLGRFRTLCTLLCCTLLYLTFNIIHQKITDDVFFLPHGYIHTFSISSSGSRRFHSFSVPVLCPVVSTGECSKPGLSFEYLILCPHYPYFVILPVAS